MIELKPRSEPRAYWEDHLRPLLRYAVLCRSVMIRNGGFDSPASHNGQGIDTPRQVDYMDALRGLWQLRSNDGFGHMLVVRSVGFHCGDERCPVGDKGHWHRQSWSDLLGTHRLEALKAREESALAFLHAFVA